MLAKWNTKRTLALGFVLVIIGLLANAAVSYQNISRVIENNARVNRTYEVLVELESTLSSVQDAETGQRGFIITGEDRYLEPYNSGIASVGGHIARLRSLIVSPSVRTLLPELESETKARLALLRRGIDLRRAQGLDSARTAISNGEGKRRMDAIRAAVAEMERRERVLLAERDAESSASVRTALGTFFVSSLATLALLVAVWFGFRRDAEVREEAAAQAQLDSDRFAALVNSTSQVVWSTSPEGEFTTDQPSWREFTGASNEEILGAGWRAAIHPDDLARTGEIWAAA
ncbi:hypothetical protein EON77_05675, partial [bacterium]